MSYRLRQSLHQAVIKLMLLSLLSATLAGLIPGGLPGALVRTIAPPPVAELVEALLPDTPVALAQASIPSTTEIRKYLVVGMGDDAHVDNGFQMSNSEIGADRHVLSNSEDVWPPDVTSSFPNIKGVFETRWDLTTDPHSLNDHDPVFEGIDWSGNVALTSDNSSFDSANSLVFADFGVGTAATKSQFDSVDPQSRYFPLGNSTTPITLTVSGTSNNNDFSGLLTELGTWKTFIDGLTAEATITKAQIETDFVNNMAVAGAGGLRTTYADTLDTNNDGVILIDVNPQDIDFEITNTDWVVNGTGNKLLIFRINDGANMNMNNVSITLGTGGVANLGAGMIFYQASEAADAPESSDAVFSGNNVILDGGAFWDLNDVGESAGGGDGHNIVINNGQGCWQFVSQKVNFQNNRWNKCAYAPLVDWGDLPDDDATAGDDSPNSPGYNTNSTNTAGPSHPIIAGLKIGATVDSEGTGQPNSTATGDDSAKTPDDEAGVTLPNQIFVGQTIVISATVVNTTGQAATLFGFIDWNADGNFLGPAETASIGVPTNTNGTVTLSFAVPAAANTTQQLGARFRLSTNASLGADGPATNGEVEDYLIQVLSSIFDLALKKTTAATTANPGDDVVFTLEVINQGTTAAYNIQVTDYITSGFTFDAANATNVANGWALVAGRPTLTLAGPLAAGNSTTKQIVLRVAAAFQGTGLTNYAEISSADNDADPANAAPVDVDSTPDATDTNDGAVKDNVVNEDGKTNPGVNDEDDHDPAPINVGQTFDLALTKTTAATTVQPGADVQFTIQVVNQGTSDAYNIVLTDYLPTGFTFDATNATNVAAGWALVAGRPTKTIAGPLAKGASMAVQIVLKVDAAFQGAILVNYAEISAADNDADPANTPPTDVDSTPDTDDANDGAAKDNVVGESGKANPGVNDEDDHDPASINVNQTFDLALKKTTAAGTVQRGDDVQFTIQVINQGTLPAYNIQLTDYVPTGFTFDPTNATNSANGWNLVAGKPTKSIAGPLAAGATTDVQLVLQVGATFQGTSLTNYAEISAADNDADSTNAAPTDADSAPDTDNTNDGTVKDNVVSENWQSDNASNDQDDHDPATVNVGQTFDLAVKKTTAATTVQQGADVQFTIQVINQGTLDAYNITLTDYVPTGFTFDATNATNSANGWSLVNGQPTLTIAGPLAAGGTTDVQIVLRVGATFQGTSLTNVAEISAADNDADPANTLPVDVDSTPDTTGTNDGAAKDDVTAENGKANPGVNDEDDHDPATVNVGQTFDLALKKTTAAATVQQGDDVQFTFTVINQGTLDAYNIVLIDYVPTGFTFDAANATNVANGWSLVGSKPTATIAGPLAQGAMINRQIVLRVDANFQGTSLANVAEISSADNDADPANTPPVDVDSTPDGDNGNDGTTKDDVVNEAGKSDPANLDEDDHDPATVNVGQTFDLAVKKTSAATTVQQGDDVQFTLTVINQGTLNAYNIQLTDYVPTGFTFDATNATNSAAGWADVAGKPTLTIPGPLAKGTSTNVQIVLRVDATFQGTSLTNVAEISAADNDADLVNSPPVDVDSTPDADDTNDGTRKDDVVSENGKSDPANLDEDDHDPATVNVGQTFDVALKKLTAAVGTVQQGDDVQFTLQVVNQGTIDAYNIVLTDYVPTGFTFDATNATNIANGWSLVNGLPTATITGPLAKGATADRQIVLRVDTDFQGTSLTNYAEISGADNDTDPANTPPVDVDSTFDADNTNDGTPKDDVVDEDGKSDPLNQDEDDHDLAKVNVGQTFDLAVKKTTAATTVQQGADVQFTLQVINQGTLDAYNIVLTDYVPTGFTFDATNATNAANGWSLVNGKPTKTIAGPLAKGASTTVQIVLKVGATFQGTSLTNVAEISAADNDADPTNTLPVDVDSTPDDDTGNDGAAKDDVITEDGKSDPSNQDEDDHDPATVNVGQTFDLAVKKTTAAGTVQQGADVQFTLQVINQGTLDAYNIALTDYVPTGFTFDAANATNVANGWSLVNGQPAVTIAGPLAQGATTDLQIVLRVDANFQATSLTNVAEISSADNDADPANTLPVDVDSTPDANDTNDGAAKDDVTNESGKANPGVNDEDDHDPATVNVGQTFDLALKKTTAATTVQQGDDVQFTIQVINQGTLDAYNIVLTDYVPAGFTFDATNATNSAVGWADVAGKPTLTLPGPLAKGATVNVQIVLKVGTTFQGTSLTNVAEISAADNDTDPANTPPVDVDSAPDGDDANDGLSKDDMTTENGKSDPANQDEDDHDPAHVNVGQTFDLAAKKTTSAGTVQQGDDVQFTIRVVNQGTLDAYNIVLTDYVPTGFTFDATNATNSAAGWADVAGKPTLTIAGPLAKGTSTAVQIVLRVGATFQGTSLTNYAEISAADNDTDPNNIPPVDVDSTPDGDDANDGLSKDDVTTENGKSDPANQDEDDHDPATVNVGQTFDLAVKKTTAATTVQQGADVQFTLQVINQGTLDAYNIALTDYVPAGFTFDATNATNIADGWSLVNGQPTKTIAGPLAKGATANAQIVLKVDANFQGTSLTNVAEISSADNDADPANPLPVDVDSTPDADDANDGEPKDDIVNEDGKSDPINQDEDDHDPAIVNVGQTFDLAVKKTTAAITVQPGDDVQFTIQVINQGTLDAYNIQLTDYVPAGFTFDAANATNVANGWSLVGGKPVATIAGPLAKGATADRQIVLRVDANFQGTSLTNVTEISAADNDADPANTPPVDVDSTPDGNDTNDGATKDDVTTEDGKSDPSNQDEDDHDPSTVNVGQTFDLALKKTTAALTAQPGDEVQFTLTVINQGTLDAYNIQLADYAPADFLFDPTNAVNTANGWSLVNGKPTKTLPGPLAKGTSEDVLIVLRVEPTFQGTSLTNYAEISSADNDTDPSNTPPVDVDSTPDSDDANDGTPKDDTTTEDGKSDPINQDEDDHDPAMLNVGQTFDLALIKTVPGDTVRPNDNVTFTLAVQNQGTLDAYNIVLTDYVPTGFTFDPADATNAALGWTLVNGKPTLTLPGSLSAGTGLALPIVLRVDATFQGTSLTNVAEISAADNDADPANTPLVDVDSTPDADDTNDGASKDNVSSENGKANPGVNDEDDHDPASVNVGQTFDLALIKTTTLASAQQGMDVLFTLTVQNQGTLDAHKVNLTDYVPTGFLFDAANATNVANGWSLVNGLPTTVITGPVAAGTNGAVQLVLQVDPTFQGRSLTNVAEISAADSDTDPNNPLPVDVDSAPDAQNSNDGTPKDDVVNEDAKADPIHNDEDDHDPATLPIRLFDWGDLPDGNAATSPNYNTDNSGAVSGPSHEVIPGLQIGAGVDGETNGQPNAAADGDDNAGAPDDEEGVTQPAQIIAGQPAAFAVTVVNTTSQSATLYGFIDWNADGDFSDGNETVTQTVNSAATSQTVTLNFSVPATATTTSQLGARFRLSSASNLGSDGPAADGEVEDYLIAVNAIYDWGDLPDASAGSTGSPTYNTDSIGVVGASHQIIPNLQIGASVDNEADGQPTADAAGDDATDDEEGVTLPSQIVAGSSTVITVSVLNSTSQAATIYGFIDWNADGDFGDLGEKTSTQINQSPNNQLVPLSFSVPATATTTSQLGARFRLSTDDSLGADGPAPNGEVEDYLLQVTAYDFGDLPDGSASSPPGNSPVYNTDLTGSAGASHVIVPDLSIGSRIDAEADGQPDGTATGDDTRPSGQPDDEEGVTKPPLFVPGTSAVVTVTVFNNLPERSATLYGFIDWNGDGDFGDLSETVTQSVSSQAGSQTVLLNYTIPATATLSGEVGARFRLSTQAGLGADGLAPDGEVEDYLVKLTPQLSLGNRVWEDRNNDGLDDADGADNAPGTDDDEPGLPSVRVKLFASDGGVPSGPEILVGPDGVLGTPDDAAGGMLTTATGHYLFASLAPGTYIVEVTTPAGYTSSTGVNAQATGAYEPAPSEETTVADGDDNGTAASATTVRSAPVALVISGEPQNEADLGDLPNPATDASSNLQVDFGFYQPLSLGNEVWLDANNDGLRLNENAAPDGVVVNLYFDADNSGVIDGGETAPISTTTTVGGLYLFRHLRTGNYQVELAPSNFPANGLLAGYVSSTGQNGAATGLFEPAPDADTNEADGDDNGSMADNGGIVSALVTLQPENEPGDEQPDNDSATPDANENLTVDFGLFRPMSLGNLVWDDKNNDGLYDADGLDNQPNTPDDETGLADVAVQLLDSQGNVVNSTTTSMAGLYLFTHLLPGDYVVVITPPAGYVSSTGANGRVIGAYEPAPDPDLGLDGAVGGGDDDRDNDDNGTTGTGNNLGKIVSLGDTLTLDGEPLGENPDNDPTTPDANENLTVDFGLFRPATLGNRVWYDVSKDGVQDATETGVPGVVVNLTLGADFVVSTTTDETGHYTFTNLLPGDYVVEFTLPPGYVRSPLDTGSNTLASDPIDSDADPATGRTVTINLVAGETDLTWDAGIYFNASLGDRVWLDQNANGVQNANEPGIPNVTVTLLDGNGQPVGNPTLTDANGFYSFPNLPPGTYQVQFTLPSGYVISPQDTGGNTPTSDLNDSDANPANGKTSLLILDPNENDPSWDAGLYLPVSLGNLVWEDKNNDGLYDADGPDNTPGTADDEPGIPNVTVKLLASGGVTEILVGADGILGTADDGPGGVKTDANGLYRFSNLTPGSYRVQVEAPVGYTSSTGANGAVSGPYETAPDPDNDRDNDDNGSITSGTPATGEIIKSNRVTLRSMLEPAAPTNDDGDSDSNSNLSVDFGLYQPLSLGNRVWNDVNNSGQVDGAPSGPEQGIPNVKVNLYSNGGATPLASTTTNSSGYYLFSNLLPGVYVVAVDKSTLPAGYISSSGQNSSLSGPYEPAPDEDNTALDNDDNGTVSGALVASQPITLTVGGEPQAEPDAGNLPNPVPDAHSNLQVDFGFYQPLSLGNLVWDDQDNNGVVNDNEPGVANVSVKLYAADGVTLIAQTTTDGDGHYRFANLAPGDYTVVIEAPAGYVSSSGQNGSASGPYEAAPDADDDRNNDDNGSVSAGTAPASLTIKAAPVTLSVNGEPAAPANDDGDSDAHSNLSVDFGIYRPLSLGNRVWDDVNNNGKLEGAPSGPELGLPNVTVNLYASDGVTLVGTTTTNATGHYLFTYLAPGDYIVAVVQSSLPAGYITSSGQNGSATGAYEPAPDEDDNPADNDDNGEAAGGGFVTSKAVTLYGDTEPLNEPDAGDLANPAEDDHSNLQVDFGFYRPAQLGNRVWWDLNKDGVQDASETGVPGVPVNLYTVANQWVGTTNTDSTGHYTFTHLAPGDYVVEFGLPTGYARSPQDTPGDDATDSDAAPATGRTAPINLSAGESDLTWDAGIYFNASLGDRVWQDLNANGLQDDSDPGVPGVKVTLFNNVNQVVGQPTLTDANGNYAFSDLPPGDYYVQFTPPAGYLISPPDVGGNQPASDMTDSDASLLDGKTILFQLDPSEHDPTWDAGLYQPASLGDRVWEDYNGNGVQEANEPGVPNVQVELLDKDGNVLASTPTDSTGMYLFTNLLPGDYHVRFTPPSGYTLTLTDQGGDASDSDADPATGKTPLTTLTSGENDLTWDAGIYRLLSLGNLVFDDRLNNGHREEPLDKGLNGVLVNLYKDVDGSGDLTPGDGAPIATTTTAGGGFYRFDNLHPGDYLVELDKGNFVRDALLERYASSLASLLSGGDKVIDPDTDRDNDDNGIQQRNPRSVVSLAVTLALNSEPHNDGDGDRYTNLSVDFGLYDPDLGDLVWFDADADGRYEPTAGEYGIADVLLNLYEDNGTTPGMYDAGDTFIMTTTTSADGFYLFGFLPPRDYIVMVDADNFQPGQPLAGLANSRGDSDPDDNINTDENGIPLTLGGAGVAKAVTLTSGGEPLDDGDGDEFTNLTIDFGFHPGLQLGNHVWHDRNDNGLLDSGEAGIAGVTVQLFWATDNPATAQPLATTKTNANGFYLFTPAGSGKYIVYLPTPPSQYPLSSAPTDTADNGEDKDDNGSQTSAGGPVISPVIDLGLGSEPTGDGDNANGDLTIDFGLLPLKPNLVLDKTVANPTVAPGGVVRYTLTYTNTGVGVARQTVLTETVAEGTTFEPSQSSPGWQCSNGGAAGALCHISLGDVTPGQRGTVNFALKLGSQVTALTLVPNVAIVGTLDVELQYTDNNDRADVYVQTPQAISLVFFTAETQEGAITLRWQTSIELNTRGYLVYRSSTGQRPDARQLTAELLPSLGLQGGDYSYTDREVELNQAYSYWLVEVDAEGQTHEYGPLRFGIFDSSLYLPLIDR